MKGRNSTLPGRAAMSVSPATRKALVEAIEDEYKARATYRGVIAAFGPVRPFVNIVEAEERHANALLSLFERFGLQPPPDKWAERVPAPSSIAKACETAVVAEIENAAMYDRLLAEVEEPSVRRVLTRLKTASQTRHLPAFRRCLAREARGRLPAGRTR